jgi:uncharacterized YccA/Bax inhibitor family protein
MANTNPVLTRFLASGVQVNAHPGQRGMTRAGSLGKTALLIAIFAVGAIFMWTRGRQYEFAGPGHLKRLIFVVLAAAIAAFALLTLTLRNRSWAPVTAPTYALLQGIVVGFLTSLPEGRNSGITVQTVCLAVVMCICLLIAHRSGLIRGEDRLRKKLSIAMAGVLVYLVASFAMVHRGMNVPFRNVEWLPGILFGLATALIAGFSLVSDFDAAVQYSEEAFPKYMEWYAALGLVLTIVWMYVEALWISQSGRGRAK